MALNPKRRQDPEGRYAERVDNITLEDAATFVASATPIIGDAMAAKEVYDELQKDDPNYILVGALGGAAMIGLIPGLGDAAASAIRSGAKKALDVGKRIEVDPNALGSLGGNIKLKPSSSSVVDEPFKKTRKAYKLFVQSDDKLYPLFVNAADEVPQGSFLEADFPDVAFKGTTKAGKEGFYVPTKGAKRKKGEKTKKTGDSINIPDEETRKKLIDSGYITEKTKRTKDAPYGKVTAVAARPGWHASMNPVAEHLGPQDLKITKKEAEQLVNAGINPKAIRTRGDQYYVKRRAEDQVWAEVEMADDTSDELLTYMKERGRTDINDKVPKGGSYSYVDGQADGDTWVVGGDMKVSRVLSREEAKSAQEAAGVKDLPYRDEVENILGKKFAQGGLIGEEDMYTGQQDYLLTSSSGTDMAVGGSISNNNEPIQTEMDLIMSETKDPVSGNTAPLGAKPEEVRDDVPINASPNEFMINAATRRYFGTEFFEELQKSAEEGWKRIRDGEESYFRDDELEVMDDEKGDRDKPINMQEGGAVPGEGITVPKPVGGGYGRYGGTGSPFMGFESKTFTNPETGQQIIIYYFNGRPMSRIPAGFREVSQNVVEEQQQVQRERDDDDDKGPVVETRDGYWNKPTNEWEPEDFTAYNKSMMDNLSKGKDPLSLSALESGVLSLVGGVIGGPAGALGMTALAKKAKQKQAESVYSFSVNSLLEGNATNKKDLAESMFLTAGGLNITGQTDFTYTAGQKKYSDAQKGTIQTLYDNSDDDTQTIIMTAGEDVAMSMPVSSSSFNLFDPSTWGGGAASTTTPESVVTDDMSFSDWYASTTGSSLGGTQDTRTNKGEFDVSAYTPSGSLTPKFTESAAAAASPEPTLTTTEKYERDQALGGGASGDRIDKQRQEQRIRDIVSGAIKPKDTDEEREFDAVISAAAG